MVKHPMTAKGAEMLRAELVELKTNARPKVIQAIAEAREHGDLKENAEYHAAREQQGFIEGRIQDIEGKLSNAQVIDISKVTPSSRVIFGTTVLVAEEPSGQEMSYMIVGDDEADIKQGKISVNAPIAHALIGKEEGDLVSVKTPGGERELEIIEVRYK